MKFLLPEAVFEQHMIVLGKTGSGKSSAIRGMVEHLLDQDKRVIVITPKADWWGLKLAADGKAPGYPIPIFGGKHQDIPLHHLSGKTMAELLGQGNRSAILQMRDFMPGERTQFWIDFASTLFRVLEGKLYLVIDEVHNFAPKGKVLDNKAGLMLHWSNKIASEARGIGITLIGASQRASKVHNDFLTSCETLIAMRVTTKWDRDAVKDWIDGCGDPDKASEVLGSLAQMKRGDAWAWSPESDFGPEQIHFPMFKTYDSFRPQLPADVAKLKGWADVDLDDVKKKLEHVVKEAEAKDPVKLQARIAELTKQLKSQPVPAAAPRIADHQADKRNAEIWEKQYKEIQDLGLYSREMKQYAEYLERQLGSLRTAITASDKSIGGILNRMTIDNIKMPVKKSAPVVERYPSHVGIRPTVRPVRKAESNGDISGPQMKILVALLELESIGTTIPPREQVAAWAEYSPESGGFNNPLGRLNVEGYISYPQPGHIGLTEKGREAGGGAMPRPDQEEVQRRVLAHCTGPERKILEALITTAGSGELATTALAEKAGYSVESGGFNNPKGRLRTKGLITYPSPGVCQAASWLFFE